MQLGWGDVPPSINRASFITILVKAIGFEAVSIKLLLNQENIISFCLFKSVFNFSATLWGPRHVHGHSMLLTAGLKSIVAQYVNAFKKTAPVKKLQMQDKRTVPGGNHWSISQKGNLLVSSSAFKRVESFCGSQNYPGIGAMTERPWKTKKRRKAKCKFSYCAFNRSQCSLYEA